MANMDVASNEFLSGRTGPVLVLVLTPQWATLTLNRSSNPNPCLVAR